MYQIDSGFKPIQIDQIDIFLNKMIEDMINEIRKVKGIEND